VTSSAGWLANNRHSYDAVAGPYTELLRGELEQQPYDRGILRLFTELVHAQGGGPVADLGCGSGRLTTYLHDLGVDAMGIDLSPAMIDLARQEHPGLRFEVGSMTDLDLPDRSLAGVLAWSSLIHVPDADVPRVLGHVQRVLRPGGVVLISFFIGDRTHHKTQGYGGHPMDLHVHHRSVEHVAGWLSDAGLTVELQMVRAPAAAVPGGVIIACQLDEEDRLLLP
jgi:SAM-dependent methyltransferase